MLLVVASQMKSNNAVMSFLIIISYTLFLLCLYLWYNSIRQWSKNKFNKFYLFFISLYLVWNFCMIFYYQTKSKTAAMLISYISSNWIAILTLPVFFHFTLLFTGVLNRIKRKWLVYISIYLPLGIIQALILLPSVYELIKVEYSTFGWHIELSLFSLPAILISIYSAGVCLGGIINIAVWGIRSKNTRIRKQALVLFITTFSVAVSSFISLFLFYTFSPHFPYTNHFATIFMVMGFKIAISQYQFMTLTPHIVLNDIIDNIEDFFLLFDLEGNVIKSNRKFTELLGFTEDDIRTGKVFEQNIALRSRFLSIFTHLHKKSPVFLESNIIARNGDIIPVQLYCSNILDKYKEEIGYIFIGHDERIRYQLDLEREDKLKKEKSLVESEQQYRLTIDSIGDYIYVIDRGCRLLLVNKACAGYARKLNIKNNLLGKVVWKVFPRLASKSKKEYERVFTTAEPVISQNTIMINDRTMLIESRKIPIVENGYVNKIITVIRDITEQKKMEDNIIRTTRLESLGILAGGIAHDFNNALTSIIVNTSLAIKLLKEAENSEDLREMLGEIENAAIQSKELAQQLLTFSTSGSYEKKVAQVDSLLKETISLVMSGTNCTVQLDIKSSLKLVEMDTTQIVTALQNILINACEAMPESGSVSVSVENIRFRNNNMFFLYPGYYVRISIKDEGPGISPVIMDRIFDPYFSTKETGSGLGLATSFTIISSHKGYIDVYNREGKGAVFDIYLPATNKPLEEKKKKQSSVTLQGISLLMLEDDKHIRSVTSKIIKMTGGSIEFALTGEEALAKYKNAKNTSTPFNVILLDLTIRGGMGGKMTMQKILEIDRDAKGIVCSGYSTDPVISHYGDYGFKGYLKKPFNVEALLDVLGKVIQEN